MYIYYFCIKHHTFISSTSCTSRFIAGNTILEAVAATAAVVTAAAAAAGAAGAGGAGAGGGSGGAGGGSGGTGGSGGSGLPSFSSMGPGIVPSGLPQPGTSN
jgi:hypothetical protein